MTAFSTSSGHWQYTVYPQGVKTGPSWFNLCVTTCLREHREYAISYFDVIVIFSKNVKDHLTHILKVKIAEKAKCLYELTKKGTSWNWTKECQDAYRHFVDRITSEPAMRKPDFTQEFIVHSDGSKNAIGGVLSQKINGVEYIVEYASRKLK